MMRNLAARPGRGPDEGATPLRAMAAKENRR